MMYTALSRTTKWEYVHLDCKNIAKYKYEIKQKKFKILKPLFNEYRSCKIYRIFDDSKVYIGMTCRELDKRLEEHKKDKKSLAFGFNDPKIELIVKCPCFSKKEAEYYENRYINKFECINKRGKFVEKKIKAEFSVKSNDEVKEKLRNIRYKICEMKDCYRIRFMTDGKSTEFKRRFGKDKEKAYDSIRAEQERLISLHMNGKA